MLRKVWRWYEGTGKTEEFENDRNSMCILGPRFYTEYHWTARVVRAVVSFYLAHWQWVWSTVLTLAGLWLAVLALR